MYEVEVKCRIKVSPNDAINTFRNAGYVHEKTVDQHDTILAHSVSDITVPRPGATVARVREQDEKATLTVKTQGANELLCVEHEVRVDRPAEAIELLKALGLREVIKVRKRRWRARRGQVTACVDEVSSLGVFVELERMYAATPPSAAQEDLHRELEAVLSTSIERVFQGYDRLLLSRIGTA